jgi:hypothetical protein
MTSDRCGSSRDVHNCVHRNMIRYENAVIFWGFLSREESYGHNVIIFVSASIQSHLMNFWTAVYNITYWKLYFCSPWTHTNHWSYESRLEIHPNFNTWLIKLSIVYGIKDLPKLLHDLNYVWNTFSYEYYEDVRRKMSKCPSTMLYRQAYTQVFNGNWFESCQLAGCTSRMLQNSSKWVKDLLTGRPY